MRFLSFAGSYDPLQPTFRRGDTSAFAAYVCTAKMLGRVSEQRRPRVEISAIEDSKIRAIGGEGLHVYVVFGPATHDHTHIAPLEISSNAFCESRLARTKAFHEWAVSALRWGPPYTTSAQKGRSSRNTQNVLRISIDLADREGRVATKIPNVLYWSHLAWLAPLRFVGH